MDKTDIIFIIEAVSILLNSDNKEIIALTAPLLQKAATLAASKGLTVFDTLTLEFGKNPHIYQKIPIIRRHRELTGLGLKESKEWVEANFCLSNPVMPMP
jgi:ribosomal protein L7/L12